MAEGSPGAERPLVVRITRAMIGAARPIGAKEDGVGSSARDLGIVIGRGQPGPANAITDVPGVRVGHATIVRGDGPLVVGEGRSERA